MKRSIYALALCLSLLVALSLFLFPSSHAKGAKDNPLKALLDLPAPPPPNPQMSAVGRSRDEKFYNKSTPPADNAPIADLLDYWARQSNVSQELRYTPEPSDKVLERLMAEIEKNPSLLPNYLSVLKNDERAVDLVKNLYDREGVGGAYERDTRRLIRRWLTFNSAYFSDDLARLAAGVSDTGDYVTNQDELLALARVDFDKAVPIIARLNANPGAKTSRVAAKWALYRHALDTGSTSDIERYRDELKEIVEDRNALPGMRDLAIDALAREKEWPGRDEWYFSLMGDETLADIKVSGQTYTGLTTLILISPDEKYIERMIEFAKSDNAVVRTAAVKNLLTRIDTGGPEVVRALLPWLDDPKWATDPGDARATLIRQLAEVEMPESVPGLIKVLDETQMVPRYYANANVASNSIAAYNSITNVYTAYNMAANAFNTTTNAGNYASSFGTQAAHVYRYSAVTALGKQKDGRAVPPLRRILSQGQGYERDNVVKSLLLTGGFTLAEQLDAVEVAAKGVRSEMDADGIPANMVSTNAAGEMPSYIARYANVNGARQDQPMSAADIRVMLGEQIVRSGEINDELARGIVDRIEVLDTRDRPLAAAYRRMILKWQNAVINLLLLRDLKRGLADTDTIVRLLGGRKELRDKQSPDVFDIRTGKPIAIGLAACLLEDTADQVTILEHADAETKTAMLACARLIRSPLPVQKVAENLKATNELLKTAAERYLESEDSPEARSIILALYPGEAKILGARTAFFVEGASEDGNDYLYAVYQSLGDQSLYNGWYGSGNDSEIKATEKRLQDEIKKDPELMGVYAYEGNYVRIYKGRVVFSWDEDDSRYRERQLTKYEFDELKAYLATNRADELSPFLACGGEYCTAKELVMLGRNGGRRVYINGEMMFAPGAGTFFSGLEKYFADLKHSPATLRYTLSRDIPGLEILLASDDLHAETVWKGGGELRIAASATAVRKKVKIDIENLDDDETVFATDYDENEAKKEALREKRRYEGVSWYRLTDGGFEGGAPQPPQVEFVPVRDGLVVEVLSEQWKARAAAFELRTSETGLFKVSRGNVTKLRSGPYRSPIVTPNGRWALVNKTQEFLTARVFRIDLLTNREYPVPIESYGEWYPSAYIPTINKVLVARDDSYGYSDEEKDDIAPDDVDAEALLLLDPATGVLQSAAGEFRPLDQQTFRPLQASSKPNEFWAAMPDSENNRTLVGIYDTKHFGFRTVLEVPKIKFNSMNMWVDEPALKIYFVYRGHLLALPLRKTADLPVAGE